MIEETLQIGGSLKATKRKLAIGKGRVHALREEQCSITPNLYEIIKVAERLYTRLCSSDVTQWETTETTSSTCDVRLVTKEELGEALKGMKIGKAAGDDGITVDPLKEGRDIVLEKLAVLFSECLKTKKVPMA